MSKPNFRVRVRLDVIDADGNPVNHKGHPHEPSIETAQLLSRHERIDEALSILSSSYTIVREISGIGRKSNVG